MVNLINSSISTIDNKLLLPQIDRLDNVCKAGFSNVTLGGEILSVAKIGVGILAADQLTKKLYPNQADKRKHAVVGGLISGVAGKVTTVITGNKIAGMLIGIGAGTVAGAAKEIRDKVTGKGTPDIHDFYATVLGATTVGVAIAF